MFQSTSGSSLASSSAPKSSSGDFGNSSHPSSTSISNYEKALISAATSIYQQQRKGGGGSVGTYSKSMPTWKQKRLQAQANRDPNKAIVVRKALIILQLISFHLHISEIDYNMITLVRQTILYNPDFLVCFACIRVVVT